jgi:transcriptional regulator with XRE-family HTH domain
LPTGETGTTDPVSRVGARIRALRVKRGLTQSALAQKAGISREYLTRLEAGRYDPKIGVIDRIAKALKTPITALVR